MALGGLSFAVLFAVAIIGCFSAVAITWWRRPKEDRWEQLLVHANGIDPRLERQGAGFFELALSFQAFSIPRRSRSKNS